MANNLTTESLIQQPENRNFLSALAFKFGIRKLPFTNYFVQKVTIPGLIAGTSKQSSPFKELPVPGDHMHHEDLQLTFRVDENLRNYLEIYAWIVGTTFPDNFGQYAQLFQEIKTSGKGVKSDATLMIFNSSNNPIVEVTYEDCFPYRLSSIEFSSTETDVQYVEATALFKIMGHHVRLLNTTVEVPSS
jgi:hypothetical protein